jgi:hypothetical protein
MTISLAGPSRMGTRITIGFLASFRRLLPTSPLLLEARNKCWPAGHLALKYNLNRINLE